MKTIMLVLFSTAVSAHEMAPTYFEFKNSIYNDIYETTILLTNRREDQTYYEISVVDENFEPVRFATSNRLVNVKSFTRQYFTLYVRKKELEKAVYICTTSKTPKGKSGLSGVTTRICSKRKR